MEEAQRLDAVLRTDAWNCELPHSCFLQFLLTQHFPAHASPREYARAFLQPWTGLERDQIGVWTICD